MNLMINNTCNRACPYCFARSKANLAGTAVAAETQDMSLASFDKYLDFHVASHLPQLKLLGGEPTLHPEFLEFLSRAHARHLETLVLTNGLWPSKVHAWIRSISVVDWKLKFLFNVNEPHLQPAAQLAHVRESMQLAGKQANCGFNIYRHDFDLQFIADLIDACGLDRTVRLGIASPIVGKENSFVQAEYFAAIGLRLVYQLQGLEQRDVLGWFDCGFPLCMFPEETLDTLILTSRGFQSICDYPIDVGPDLTAWPCFPLSDFENVPISDFRDAAAIQAHFRQRLSAFRRNGTLEACQTCKFLKRGQCCGGCGARAVKDQAWASRSPAEHPHEPAEGNMISLST